MPTLEVITYGGGTALVEVFNAIGASMYGSGAHGLTPTFHSLLGIFTTMGAMWAAWHGITRRNMTEHVKWIMAYIFIFNVVLLPQARVVVIDRIQQALGERADQSSGVSVDHVPLSLAIIASVSSRVGDALTHLMEATFSLPDDARYSHTGMVMASRMLVALQDFRITDPVFATNIARYMKRCAFYDMLQGKYSLNRFMQSSHVLELLQAHASPARSLLVTDPTQHKDTIKTCREAFNGFTHQLQQQVDTTAQRLGRRLFPDATQSVLQTHFKAMLLGNVGYLTGLSEQASQLLVQNLLLHAIEDGIVSFNAGVDAQAAMTSFAFNKAQQQKRTLYKTMSQMAAYWLPLMNIVFQAILYGAFMIVIVLAFLPFGLQVIKYYVYSLAWLQIWAPLYAIFNMVITLYAKAHTSQLLSTQGLTLMTQSEVVQINDDISSLAGFMAMSIPFLSLGLVRGMASAFTSVAQLMNGSTQSMVSQSVNEAVTGNISLGNTQFANHSAHNVSANHFDTNASVSSGHFTHQLAGGGVVTMTPSGQRILNLQGGLSNMGSAVHLSQAIQAHATQQAEHSLQSAYDHAHQASTSLASAFRALDEVGHQQHVGNTQLHSGSLHHSQALTTAASDFYRHVDQFSKQNSISHELAYQAMTAGYVSLNLGVEGKAGAGLAFKGALEGGLKAEWQHLNTEHQRSILENAQQYVKEHQFSQTVEHARHAAQEWQRQAHSSAERTMARSIASSLDSATQEIKHSNASLHEAQSYQQLSQLTREQGVAIDTNAQQAFANWIVKQPIPGGNYGTMTYSQWEQLVQHSPADAQAYTARFVEESTQADINAWARSHHQGQDSTNTVLDAYQRHEHYVTDDNVGVSQQYATNQFALNAEKKG